MPPFEFRFAINKVLSSTDLRPEFEPTIALIKQHLNRHIQAFDRNAEAIEAMKNLLMEGKLVEGKMLVDLHPELAGKKARFHEFTVQPDRETWDAKYTIFTPKCKCVTMFGNWIAYSEDQSERIKFWALTSDIELDVSEPK